MRIARAGLTLQLQIARELCELPESFPESLRVSLATAALTGNFDEASPALAAFADESPEAATQARSTLSIYAPVLSQFARTLLVPRVKSVGRYQAREMKFPYWMWIMAFVALSHSLHLCGSM